VPTSRTRDTSGFTLIETLIAMGLVTIGLLALAGAIGFGSRALLGSQDQLVASQRAAEAIEGVFKARDSRVLLWARIQNALGASGSDGGVFLDGPQSLRNPGPDGVINTVDDSGEVEPGLREFTREIEIRNLGPSLRRVRVIVRYPVAGGTREFVLITFVSSYA
jgi:prepilin-type N-terminal cleavage/methylation domain-containing protein